MIFIEKGNKDQSPFKSWLWKVRVIQKLFECEAVPVEANVACVIIQIHSPV